LSQRNKEALANAVYHRAYNIREPIEVRIEPDRIEILSFPGPDRSVTLEGLKSYRVTNRRYRNRRIGEMLKELHLTEGRNTGFKKILTALEHNGSPKPEFETDEVRSYFISRFYLHPDFRNMAADDKIFGANGANGANLSQNERLILEYVKNHPEDSTKEIAGNMSLSLRTTQRSISTLKKKGFLGFMGTRKKGKWVILKE